MFACACLRVSRAQANSAAPSATTTQCDQPATASGATSGDTSNKTPGDLYKEAMHPLEVVRGSLDNWSDAELGALAVGMHQAGEDCAKLKPGDYNGDDLFELARLCTFGQ